MRPTPHASTSKDKTCTRCEPAGHLADECLAKRKKDGTVQLTSRKEPPPQKKNSNRREVLNIESEWEANWGDPTPAKPSTSDGVIALRESPSKATNLVIGSKDELIKVPININGETLEAVIDTGAYSTVIDSALAKKVGWEPTGPGPRLIGANRTELSVLGVFKAEIKLKLGSYVKLKYDQMVIVGGLPTPLLVGLELMNSLGLCIDITQKKVSFARTTLPKGVFAHRNENIPARSQALIPARVNYIGTIITSPIGNLRTANSISETKDGSLSLVVLNQDTKEINLKKGSQLASFEPICDKKPSSAIQTIMTLGKTGETVQVGSQLNEKQLKQLESVILEHLRAFSINGQLGTVKGHVHDIELEPSAKPFAEPLRRRAQVQIEETRRQIKELLKQGIIEDSNSPWASAY